LNRFCLLDIHHKILKLQVCTFVCLAFQLHNTQDFTTSLRPWEVASLPSGASPGGDRGTLTRYGGYRGNKIPGVNQN